METSDDLKRYQNCAFNILVEFDRFSKEHDISYFIIGGTLLGAVRHKGFIPWDDDIDIGVPRKDYNKLKSLYGKFKKPYVLESYEISKEHIVSFAKLYDTSTTVAEDLGFDYNRGVWIDVFPIDGTFDNNKIMNLHLKMIDFISMTFRLKVKIKYNLKIFKKTDSVFRFLVKCAIYLIPQRVNYIVLNSLVKIKSIENSKNVGNLLGRYGPKEIVNKEVIFGTSTSLQFENAFFYAPSEYEKYLETVYGDYMKLPEESERIYHAKRYVNLDKPYIKK